MSRAAMLLYAALLVAWLVKELTHARRGLPVSWGKHLVVGSTIAMWFLGIVVLNSDYAFTVTNVIVHGVPYLGLVFFTEKARGAAREAAGKPPTLAGFAARSAALFLVPLFALAFLEEWGWDLLVWHENRAIFPGPALDPGTILLALIVPLLALPQATHYVLDGFIWKVRPENRAAIQALGLPDGVDNGAFWSLMQAAVDFRYDVLNGVINSFVFGIAVTVIATFEGFDAPPTAEGVSGATTRTVVSSALAILALDLVLTASLLRGET